MILEILAVRRLEGCYRWLKLLLELEENVTAESLAQLRELLDESAVVPRQQNEDFHRDVLRILRKWLDLFLQSLLQIELFVVDDEPLLDVPLLLGQLLLLVSQHLLVHTQVVQFASLLTRRSLTRLQVAR